MSPLRAFICMSLGVGLGRCAHSKPAKPQEAVARDLSVAGQIKAPSGAPLANAAIYVEGEADPQTTSNSDGTFEVKLDETAIARQIANLPPAFQALRLYAELPSSPDQVGASEPISLKERGHLTLASPIVVGPKGSLSGKVLALKENQELSPAQGAKVRFGRWTVNAGEDGSFVFDRVPGGSLTLTASAPLLADSALDLTLAQGEKRNLKRPIVIYPEQRVVGTILADEVQGVAQLIASGHPYQRQFSVFCSKQARFVRWSFNAQDLLKGEWQDIPETLAIDFPRGGANSLYYQFAGSDQQHLSAIDSQNVVIDEFQGTNGLVIEDGSGHISRREATLHLDVPPAAFRVRMAESTQELALAPWMVPLPVMNYTFNLYRDPVTGLLQGFGQRTLFMQYANSAFATSPVYQATVIIDLFPAPKAGPVFEINAGAPLATERIVRLDIQVPPNAYEMRVFEAITDLPTSPISFGGTSIGNNDTDKTRATNALWLAVQPYLFFTFPSPGIKTLYLQFRTRDQVLSPVYQQTVRVDPFPPSDVGFQIQPPASPSPYLTLDLVPPPNAVLFRMFELGGANLAPWLQVTPHARYTAQGSGLRTIYVQYRSADLDDSGVFSQSIEVAPFPPEVGAFALTGSGTTNFPDGTSLALTRTFAIAIDVPPNAQSMAIGEGVAPISESPNWVAVNNFQVITVSSLGPTTLYLKFKTPDGLFLSDAIQRTVFVDPFPLGKLYVKINGGAAQTTSAQVNLDLTVTPNITQFRVANKTDDLQNAPWQEIQDHLGWKLEPGDGYHKVYVQYRTAEGDASPVYFADIEKVPA